MSFTNKAGADRTVEIEESNGEDLIFQPAPQSLDEIGVAELLEQDSRPTFILDLHIPQREIDDSMNIVW